MRRHLARSLVLLVATIAGVLQWQTRRLEAETLGVSALQEPIARELPPEYRAHRSAQRIEARPAPEQRRRSEERPAQTRTRAPERQPMPASPTK